MDILAVVGDMHCNSRQGLMPPRFVKNEGGIEYPSEFQRWIWKSWLNYWKTVAKIKKKKKGRVVCLINGEGCDINKHNNAELVSTDPSDALRMALDALKVTESIVDTFVVSYGTEAHVGANGLMDRWLAESIGAKQHGHINRFYVGNMLVHAQHHPKYNSRVKWSNSMNKLAVDLELSYYRVGWPLPDLAVYGHVHDPKSSSTDTPIFADILPSWKLSDSFVSRIGESFPAPIGGGIYWMKNGRLKKHKGTRYEWPLTIENPFQKVLD